MLKVSRPLSSESLPIEKQQMLSCPWFGQSDAGSLGMKVEVLTRSQHQTRLSEELLASPRQRHRTFHLLSRSLRR